MADASFGNVFSNIREGIMDVVGARQDRAKSQLAEMEVTQEKQRMAGQADFEKEAAPIVSAYSSQLAALASQSKDDTRAMEMGQLQASIKEQGQLAAIASRHGLWDVTEKAQDRIDTMTEKLMGNQREQRMEGVQRAKDISSLVAPMFFDPSVSTPAQKKSYYTSIRDQVAALLPEDQAKELPTEYSPQADNMLRALAKTSMSAIDQAKMAQRQDEDKMKEHQFNARTKQYADALDKRLALGYAKLNNSIATGGKVNPTVKLLIGIAQKPPSTDAVKAAAAKFREKNPDAGDDDMAAAARIIAANANRLAAEDATMLQADNAYTPRTDDERLAAAVDMYDDIKAGVANGDTWTVAGAMKKYAPALAAKFGYGDSKTDAKADAKSKSAYDAAPPAERKQSLAAAAAAIKRAPDKRADVIKKLKDAGFPASQLSGL
jgi:hypothetical protein